MLTMKCYSFSIFSPVPYSYAQEMSIVFQFLCAMTSPIGKLVVSYVEENHKVSSKLVHNASILIFQTSCYSHPKRMNNHD